MGTWRLLLAWLVVANHTSGLRDLSSTLELGKVAVATFFFVSGFLMPLTYNSHYSRYGTLRGSRRFYLNRFLRIYPIYWVSLVATLLATAHFGPNLLEHAATLQDLHRPRVYLSNALLLGLNQTLSWGGDFRFNPPSWTLDVELQYYALVPFLLALTARWPRWSSAALIAIAGISLYLFFRPAGLLDIDRSLLAWTYFFLLGYAFYLSPWLQRLASRKALLIAAICILLAFARLTRSSNLAILLVTLAFIAMSAHLLVLQQNRRFGRLDRLLGDLSYPTYILHWICVELVLRWVGPDLLDVKLSARFALLLALNILVSTLVAYISLQLIGNPIERIRRGIRDTGDR